MHLRYFRCSLAALFALALIASACGGDASDDSAAPAATSTAAALEPDPTPVPAEDGDATAPATEEPVAEEPAAEEPVAEEQLPDDEAAGEDPAVDSSILTPSDELLYQLNQVSFGIDTTQAEIDCMQVYFTYELAAGRTYFSVADPELELDDQGLQDLAYASNGCVNGQTLYGWAAAATGITGDDLTNGPDCFTTWFGDETWGDTVFHSFTALTFQYRLDPEAQADLINSLVDCAPVASLSEFVVQQAEAASDFTIEVDYQCVFDSINNDDASLLFWETLVEGTGVPIDVMTPYVDACSTAVAVTEYTGTLDDFAPFSGARQLTGVDPSLRNGVYTEPPALTIDPAARYEAVISTGGGEVRISLLADIAPNTVNNFVNLANDGFYDGLTFHRVIDDFMAQGGDPTGGGSGGPGYAFADEFDDNPPLDRKGMLAMANSGADTNGSQFFITTAPTEWLNGAHTVFGVVISGQEYIDAITPRDPLSPTGRAQVIDSITIVAL